MMTANGTKVDQLARARFDAERNGYAGISAIKTIYRADSLSAHRQEFRDGKRGARDACRAQVHLEAAGLRNATARVLEFYLAVGRAGYDGSCVPEEIAANQVTQATGGLCAPRTYRAALAQLCRLGWLSKQPIPTGTRVIVSISSRGPVWRSLRINKITLTRAARLLIAKRPPADWTPKSSPAAAIARGGLVKMSPLGDLAHTGIPWQKLPATVGDNPQNGGTSKRSPRSEGSNVDLEYDTSSSTQNGTVKESKESPTGDILTRPPRAIAAATCKHQTSQTATDKPSRKGRKKSGRGLGYRKARNATPRTWDRARKLLLHDLYSAYYSDFNIDVLYRVVSVQTDRDYPPACAVVLNWDDIVWGWFDLSWHDRRRCLSRKIYPALKAFAAHLLPPPPEATAEEIQMFKRLRSLLSAMPTALPSGVPPETAQLIQSQRFALETVPAMLVDGRLSPREITSDTRAAFGALAALTKEGDR